MSRGSGIYSNDHMPGHPLPKGPPEYSYGRKMLLLRKPWLTGNGQRSKRRKDYKRKKETGETE